jgi:hypothetical protein
MKSIYRIQDKDGRGPWKPGFSLKWIRENPDWSLKPWMFTMGPVHQKAESDEICGCGCLTKAQLRRWILKSEYEILLGYGYKAVKLKGRILGEDKNQCIFARQQPLNQNCKEFKLYETPNTPAS